MEQARVNIVVMIVGDRGTGKTTFFKGDPSRGIEGVLNTYTRKRSDKKILIVDTFDNPAWRHIPEIPAERLGQWTGGPARVFSSDTDALLTAISNHVYNAVILFEDATKYIGSKLNKDTKKFILDSKQKNLDLYFIFHYLGAVPNDLSRVSDWLVLFKTKENFTPLIKNKFANPVIEATFNSVKRARSWFYYEPVQISG